MLWPPRSRRKSSRARLNNDKRIENLVNHLKTKRYQIPCVAGYEREIEAAAAVIRRGGLLAIPTETVYGLGADALNEEAVRSIYEAKGRPSDNPLILHLPGPEWLERYCRQVPQMAYDLAEAFWPGPLTMILNRDPVVPQMALISRSRWSPRLNFLVKSISSILGTSCLKT